MHDALSARIFAADDAPVLFLSGFGISACRLGQPDAGILTLSEMEDAARSVISATRDAKRCARDKNGDRNKINIVPVIVDGDTGHGGPSNVQRTIRSLAAAGAAAVTIEDQQFPKQCTFAAGGGVKTVEYEECIDRIRAAIVARDEARYEDGNDVLLVARTDCRMERGLEEVVRRCIAFRDMGADIVYAENLQSREEYVDLRLRLGPGVWTMLAQLQLDPANERGEKSMLHVDEIGEMGYDLALFGVSALQAYVGTLRSISSHFFQRHNHHERDRREGRNTTKSTPSPGFLNSTLNIEPGSFETVKQVVGFSSVDEFAAKCYKDSKQV